MHFDRRILRLVFVLSVSTPVLQASPLPVVPPTPSSRSSQDASAPDLSIQRTLLVESNVARNAGDYASSRAIAREVVTYLLALPEAERDATWAELLDSAARAAWLAQDFQTAGAAWATLLEFKSRTLPADHPDLQAPRANVANTLQMRGDLAGARALQEQVLEALSRTAPADHPELQKARLSLSNTLYMQGDLQGARVLQEKLLEFQSRTLPGDHPDLQMARIGLAITLGSRGDLAGARALYEMVLEVHSRTLPDEHPELQAVRANLAITLYAHGDYHGARALQEKVLKVQSRILPDEHPALQRARACLANTLFTQGDLAGARALEEKVLEVQSRTLPAEHPELQVARYNLANTLYSQGDLAGTRALLEKALEVLSRTRPDEHAELQHARALFASLLFMQGDVQGARALQEKVLEVQLRTLPDDHPDLQSTRRNLALTIVQERARELRLQGGEGESRSLRERARERCAELIGATCRAHVQAARAAILTCAGREAEERCASLTEPLDRCLSFAQGYGVFECLHELESPAFVFAETTRGAALAAAELTRSAAGASKYAELRETLRDAGDELARLAQQGTTSEEFDRARVKRESVERELASLARELTGGKATDAEFDVESLARRLRANEATVSFRRYMKSRMDVIEDLDAEDLDASGPPAVRARSVDSLCAFVVRGSRSETQSGANGALTSESSPVSPLTLVDLGAIEPIEEAARTWRAAIGVGLERGMAVADVPVDRVRESGEELRRLVFDPLIPALGTANRVVFVPDDVLHLVALDSLPLADSDALVGDRWRIETRATLTELLTDSPPPTGTALVALGGASFNSAPAALSAEDVASIEEAQPTQVASLLRGTTWERGFAPLTHTGDEARGIGALYTEVFEDDRPVLVLEKRKASREALEELAPKARFVHIATHGWFAPESIKSWSDAEPLDKRTGLGTRMSGAEQVKGMSPMLLCGLALAGANLPENAVGRAPGLVTADELSTLDLSNCELAVLSACDTNVGERRAGQGVASLQKALQMAGARSVITSLWKVPDEATKELMLDFYRRLWVEKKPKHQALWEAKTKLRETKDEHGAPKYTTRDWAAWVLTGAPD